MPTVDVTRIPRVALAFQNEDHDEEGRLLNALVEAIERKESDVLSRLDALIDHTRAHFAREDAAMREAGFPAYAVHGGEHERVLAQMEEEARAFREADDSARLLRYVSTAVPAWFLDHIRTMDAVTGQYLAARRAGGA